MPPLPWGASLAQTRRAVFDALLYKKHPRLYREKIGATPPLDYYLATAALVLAPGAMLAGAGVPVLVAGLAWLALTARLCMQRLRGGAATRSSNTVLYVLDIVVTSALIPPLAVFWPGRGDPPLRLDTRHLVHAHRVDPALRPSRGRPVAVAHVPDLPREPVPEQPLEPAASVRRKRHEVVRFDPSTTLTRDRHGAVERTNPGPVRELRPGRRKNHVVVRFGPPQGHRFAEHPEQESWQVFDQAEA